jgi:hypothetical protein
MIGTRSRQGAEVGTYSGVAGAPGGHSVVARQAFQHPTHRDDVVAMSDDAARESGSTPADNPWEGLASLFGAEPADGPDPTAVDDYAAHVDEDGTPIGRPAGGGPADR